MYAARGAKTNEGRTRADTAFGREGVRMTILTVGAEQQYKTIKAAVAASQDGDTIYVQAGTYVNDVATVNHKISIIGVGGMVQMTANKILPNDKGFFVVNNDVTIDHFDFSGAKSYAYNGAGIRYQNGNLTVTNSYFHDNQNGIMGNPSVMGTGSVTVKNSEFDHNGAGDGQSHNIYIGYVKDFTITDSYTHNAHVGHEIKSRALNNTITNNRIDDENGDASYSIDLPAGGNALVAHNVITQGLHSPNKIMVSYAAETNHPQWGVNNLVIQDNIVSNAITYKPVFLRNVSSSTPIVDGNKFYGLDASSKAQLVVGNGTLTNNQMMSGTGPAVDTSHPWSSSSGIDHIVSVGIGDDVLHGTAQNDLFVGGIGQDVFVITSGGGNDLIADFKAGAGLGDVVALEGTNFTSFAGVKAAMSQHGTDVVLDLGKGEVLTFQNADINAFADDDFTFATAGATTSSLSSPVQVQLFKLPKTPTATTTIGGSDTKNDLLIGTAGNDSLSGGKGADTMQGGTGGDTYKVDDPNDIIVEKAGEGVDLVYSKIASYTMAANVENMITTGSMAHLVIGNELNNMMTGGLNSTLNGMDGNDVLIDLYGTGQLTGGTGNDIFQFSLPTGGISTVTDFTIGQDLLDFSVPTKAYTGLDPVADGVLSLRSDGHGGTIFAVDPTHSGTMVDVVDVQNIAPTAFHMGYDYVF
jgi:Ca2+-binding RTX toxin-like protein